MGRARTGRRPDLWDRCHSPEKLLSMRREHLTDNRHLTDSREAILPFVRRHDSEDLRLPAERLPAEPVESILSAVALITKDDQQGAVPHLSTSRGPGQPLGRRSP